MNRLLIAVSISLVLIGCDQSRENCLKVKPGMRLPQVMDIMGEARDSYLMGHPPIGIMLIYGDNSRDKWPHEPNGPIAVAMDDALSGEPADRTVSDTYCHVR